jgi:hypothetical protein
MDSTEFITIQKYAAQNRLSIHTVIKKTMNGELPTIVKEIDGKEVTFIRIAPSEPIVEIPKANEIDIDYKKEYEALNREYLILKTKYEKLLQAQSDI